ncbi:MAG: transposase [Candidatus Omnitrophota bacterium]
MKRTRYSEEQIIRILKEAEAGAVYIHTIHKERKADTTNSSFC